MTDLSYVRTQMLDEKAPPGSNVGIIGWMRNNLFSSVLNSVLTIAAFSAIYFLLAGLLPWVFQGVWTGGSLSACRAVVGAFHGEGADAACWAVINERFRQLVFGFYPADLYWRPILAFVGVVVAIAPILFDRLPRKMLAFTALFPFIGVWLLWGGSIWGYLLVLAGFFVGYVAFKVADKSLGSLAAVIIGPLFAIIWWLFFVGMISTTLDQAIGSSRMPDAQANLEAEVADLRARIAPLEEKFAPIEATIAELNGTIVDEQSNAETIIEAHSELGDVLADSQGTLVQLRKLRAQLDRKRSLLNRVRNLPRAQTKFAEDQLLAVEMRDGLPASVADMGSMTEITDSISDADRASLQTMLNLEENLVLQETSISTTYQVVGLVGLAPVGSSQFGGFLLSILIGLVGIVCSLPIGIVLALGRQSDLVIVKAMCVGFIEFIRGVPLITLLIIASTLLAIFLPPGTNFDKILRVMIMVTLFSSAYMAEVIRGGLAALPTGQYEAADALGLDYWKAQRLIIMPQALKISIPNIVSIFIGLFKDTTLVSIISLMDPLGFAKAIQATGEWNGIVWELYAFIAFVFFIFCFSMGRYSMYLERKLQTGH